MLFFRRFLRAVAGLVLGLFALLPLSTLASRTASAQDGTAAQPVLGRHALLVTNSDYKQLDALPTTKIDGEKISELLAGAGYAVTPLGNVDRAGFHKSWSAFLDGLGRIEATNVAVYSVFYFSGHGAEVGNDSFLLPVEMPKAPTDINISTQGISLRKLFDEYKVVQAQLVEKGVHVHGIFIIDACRSRPADRTKSFDKPGAAPVVPPPGMFVFYAAGSGQVAHTSLLEGAAAAGDMSVYTSHLVAELGKRGQSLQTAARQVRWQVHRAVSASPKRGQPQTPEYFDTLPPGSVNLRGETVADGKVDATVATGALSRDEGQQVWECEECPHLVVVRARDGADGTGGPFRMGSPTSEPGHRPSEEAAEPPVGSDAGDRRLEVLFPEPFAIGMSEVTVAQFRAFLVASNGGACPRAHPVCAVTRGDMPATDVTWNEAKAYVGWLNATRLKELKLEPSPGSKTGYYRLPTEAEWEYAARGGAEGRFVDGDDASRLCKYGNGADQSLHALVLTNDKCDDGQGRGVAQVRSYKPNNYGLYDVHGNVWEWVADCWSDKLVKEKSLGHQPYDRPDCPYRVARGGSWLSSPDALRLAMRTGFSPGHARPTVGFRVVRVLPPG